MTFATTSTDLAVDFAQPMPEQINFHDIALGLSKCCRFAGQCDGHYSVAQHSVLVALLLPESLRWEGLLHDATEAYMGDLSTPLKSMLPDYKKVESRLDAAIRIRAGLPMTPNPLIKQADEIALAIEARDLMPASALKWPVVQRVMTDANTREDLHRTVKPIETWQQAYVMFVNAMRALAPKSLYRDIPAMDDFQSMNEPVAFHMRNPGFTSARSLRPSY